MLAMTTMIQHDPSLPVPIEQLPDTALVRVIVATPSLDPAAGSALTMTLGKLFTQFAREDRVQSWSTMVVADGAVLLCAWTGGALSGCSHDKLHGVLAHYERDGLMLLDTPPIAVRGVDGWRHGTRADLRAWIAAGAVSAASVYVDRTVATLGEWRARGLTRLDASPLARLVSA